MTTNNDLMNIRGTIRNGVVELECGTPLPDGTEVIVTCQHPAATLKSRRVSLPLVPSTRPGSICLTAERVAELLEDADVSA